MTRTPPTGGLTPGLWTERPVDETMAVYDAWAATYEAEVSARGYRTPGRVARALAAHLPEGIRPVLDFGCGTGLSGLALLREGIGPVHGTDIVEAMVAEARQKDIYEKLWTGQPGVRPADPGVYRALVATGVVSLGAAPPETMDLLVDALAPGDVLAMSFNDPTLEHGGYDDRLGDHVEAGSLRTVFREHGPHLDDVGMGSDVIVLERA